MERVSGNVMDFHMSSLLPASRYTVKVFAARDVSKSAATSTEFTTGDYPAPLVCSPALLADERPALSLQMWTLPAI